MNASFDPQAAMSAKKNTAGAREAGVGIKPGVKRGFASATPGKWIRKKLQPAKRAADPELSPATRAYDIYGPWILGFDSQSLASPQALCSRPLRGLINSS